MIIHSIIIHPALIADEAAAALKVEINVKSVRS